jgi:alkanesulfonate monooxygenase SsuD/methylene tetrahydromethanopterin reductase-like flavin-dependent oxidoreductase (luciferase family)
MEGTHMERIGVAFSGGLGPREIVECVTLAESLGYHSAWVAEGHGGDQFAILAACATATHRILLGTSISSVFVRSAPTIAMAAATVDQLSGGRFILGLGSSHRVQVEPEHGIPFVLPTKRLRETVDVVRALMRDGVVAYYGDVIKVERFDLWFPPLRPTIPVYLSALFPTMLEIAGEISDGVLMTWPTLSTVRRAVERVAISARKSDRDPAAVEIGSLIPCVIASSRAEALEGMRPAVGFYAGFFPRYNRLLAEAGFADEVRAIKGAFDHGGREAAAKAVPDALIDAVALAGTPEQCRDRIAAYRSAGLRLPIVSPRASGPSAKATALAVIRACAP